jgi:hypothetical protein
MIAFMSANIVLQNLNSTRSGRLGLATVLASLTMLGGCASAVGHRAPVQYDLRGPISPAAATVLTPAEARSVFAEDSQNHWIPGERQDPTVLLALSKAPAAAADPSLLAGGF